nr:MAG TPA: hypothetical protein [Caudoviricetes sp.]
MHLKLNTPAVNSMNDVRKEIIEMTAEKIHSRFTYPNGLILEFIQDSTGTIDLKTNWTVKNEPDGSISFVQPEK